MYVPRDQFRDVFSYSPFLDIGFRNGVFPIFSAISWREHVYFQKDDEVRIVLDQHA
jgi:hypothetical protein